MQLLLASTFFPLREVFFTALLFHNVLLVRNLRSLLSFKTVRCWENIDKLVECLQSATALRVKRDFILKEMKQPCLYHWWMLSSTRQQSIFISHQTFQLLWTSHHPPRLWRQEAIKTKGGGVKQKHNRNHSYGFSWWTYWGNPQPAGGGLWHWWRIFILSVRYDYLWRWITVHMNCATPPVLDFGHFKPS